ncbi:MAG TPA: potassium channel protein, partial [Arcobacter sp.]|nr:potassium channel protein [Arcobacter sp.]
ILYVYEGNGLNDKVDSFFDAMYWSFITVSTIGYGDITPQTDIGKSVTLILILTGYTVIAFFTSIVTSTISEKLDIIKENNALTNASKLKDYILVCGYGKVGQVLVDNLKKHQYAVLVIEINPQRVELAEKNNITVIKDDATSIDLLKRVGINNNVRSVIALSDNDEVNLSIILAVRSISSHINIISRCNKEKTKSKLKLAGANEVFDITGAASLVGLGFMNHPVAFDAIDDILIDHRGAIINEIEIFDTSNFIGKSLQEINFKRFNITFIGVIPNKNKNQFIFNPNKTEYIIEAKDYLVVVGYELTIREFKAYLQV